MWPQWDPLLLNPDIDPPSKGPSFGGGSFQKAQISMENQQFSASFQGSRNFVDRPHKTSRSPLGCVRFIIWDLGQVAHVCPQVHAKNEYKQRWFRGASRCPKVLRFGTIRNFKTEKSSYSDRKTLFSTCFCGNLGRFWYCLALSGCGRTNSSLGYRKIYSTENNYFSTVASGVYCGYFLATEAFQAEGGNKITTIYPTCKCWTTFFGSKKKGFLFIFPDPKLWDT